jgi:hypothetical protein
MADSPFIFDDFKDQLKYLQDRGLDEITTKRLGLEVKTATWLHEQGFPKVPGLSRGIVWRLRDLRGVETGKLGAKVFYQKGIIADTDKPKFLPPKGQVPGIYYSPLANWDKLKYGQRIFICESYLKADICAMLGFHAIGVSGCWGWSHGKELLWDFKDLPWRDEGLVPVICMDSDVNPDNPKLYNAARKYNAEMAVRCGVHAEIIVLPGDAKQGLDDYYVSEGKAKTIALLEGESEPLPDAMSDHLKIMGTEVAVIDQIARLVRIDDGLLMSRGDFENLHYADRQVWTEDGKPIPVAKQYLKWEPRTVVNELVYRPGEERIKVPLFYNAWKGMGVEPLAANTDLFTSWIDDCFATEVEREFILDWWAWQLQNLGGKLTTGLVMVGPPGIGKGWVTAIFAKIFGRDNVASVPLTVLERHFNAEVATKQLFVVEETDEVGSNNQTVYNKLKDMITNPILRLEKKGVDAIYIENHLNVFLTGNQVGIFKLDASDRRFMVAEATAEGIANNPEYWDRRWEWLADGAGAEAVYALLLRRDLARFNPNGMAPMTAAKQDMIEITHQPLDLWIADLVASPEDVLVAGQSEVDGSLCSARELCWLYHEGRTSMVDLDKKEIASMNRALKNARVPCFPKKIKPKGGVATNYFIIRPLPQTYLSAASLVNERLFWMHLNASEQGKVADQAPEGSQKY